MSDAPQKPEDNSQDDAKAQEAKPSLQDIADKDSASGNGEEASEASPQKPSGGNGFVWFLIVVALVGGSVAAGWPYIGPKVEPVVGDLRNLMGLGPRPTQATLPSTQSAASQAPVAEMPSPAPEAAAPEIVTPESASPTSPLTQESEPAGSEPVSAPTAMTGAEADALATRLDVLESRVEALGTMSGADGKAALEASGELARALNALQAEVAALSERIAALEEAPRADPTAPAQALVLAATQVRARLMGDGPFAAELSALDHIAGGDPAVHDAIARLRPHAEVGVPTEAALTARFAKVAKAIMTARTTGEAEGWLGRVKDGLGGLVTVRRTDPAAITDEVERAVAIAEAALELGELAEAVDALSGLEGAPGDAAAAWLGDARARVQAEAALEELHRHALAALSAAGGQ